MTNPPSPRLRTSCYICADATGLEHEVDGDAFDFYHPDWRPPRAICNYLARPLLASVPEGTKLRLSCAARLRLNILTNDRPHNMKQLCEANGLGFRAYQHSRRSRYAEQFRMTSCGLRDEGTRQLICGSLDSEVHA